MTFQEAEPITTTKARLGWVIVSMRNTRLERRLRATEPDRRHRSPRRHGTQYTSLEFTNRLHDWGLVGSYGSVGDCYDNAAMETFWASIKNEIRHSWGPIEQRTRSEMRTILFDYIETFYNRTRHQARLDHRTPAEVYAAAMTG